VNDEVLGADEVVTFPGATAPDRSRRVDVGGVGIATYEWGSPHDPIVFCVHGGFDFARTFDVFAPKLAAGGWRVVSWDQRGHGDSDHAALNSWDADLRDAIGVLDAYTHEPAPVIGHSKGGSLVMQLADAQPFRFSRMVNLDGLPFRRRMPDMADHERTQLLAADVDGWLEHRRRAGSSLRKPGTLDELAARRRRMNPRLSIEWLRYLVSVGARRDPDGWRWKLDPSMRMGGFGPWRPEWSALRLTGIQVPFLGVLATVSEEMGWGTTIDDIRRFAPTGARLVAPAGIGHFVHIERPDEMSELILDFLADS
jgi:pimeloyl-ACP methyl ester carboxylesterase